MSSKYEILVDNLAFPEGPLFTPDGLLWCVEIKGDCLGTFDGAEYKRISTGGGVPNGLASDEKGRIYVCDAGKLSVRMYDPQAKEWSVVADKLDGKDLGKPNDLAFDTEGNLLFTCPNDGRTEPAGYVCVVRRNGDVEVVRDQMYFANGLAFSKDGKTLIVAETYKHRLWKGGWDVSQAKWIDPAPWAEVGGPIGPDGFAFGEDGNLYVAVYGSGRIKVVNHEGEIVNELELPGSNPTNCAFDPQGRWGLVVTEAEKGLLVSFPDLGPGIPMIAGKA